MEPYKLPPTTSYLSLLVLSLFFAYPGHCATTASGPTAAISIKSAPPFATLRPCAATCLVYQGSFACGVNNGYYDLAIELSCGCNPQNFCFCDSKAGTSASSFISSCVSKGCGADFPGEVANAMDIYNGYCATANVAAAVQTSTSGVTASASATSTPKIPISNPNATTEPRSKDSVPTTGARTTVETSVPGGATAASEKKGLAQSDVIALAVGLGVGVPSLLLAVATFCMQRKKRERQHRASPEVHYVNM
ncbi:uncharacterized protein RSE6_06764 [Rhynchosporium secalis]|uniref:Extracellular membrane protein CFEM domain-containing protein n=1 Tax=Rhynchosporium secalis TaxID=38038 RepID=A0A1E1MB57_RHYSE|nr:uncharacterized protein RSE6_06764 [Rhynchosporium secalis]